MTFEAAAQRLRDEITREIEVLRRDLICVEDHDGCDEQSKLIRRQIRDRQFELNMIPRQER